MKNTFKIILATLIALPLYAFRLSPLSDSIIIGKDKNTVVYQVTNNTDKPMAIEASLVKREMNIDGSEKLPAVDDKNFIIYPNQIILKPAEKRGIKVTWLGQNDIKSELSYRLKIEQLPIDFDKKKKTGIKIIMKYLGALYISKEEFKSDIHVDSISVEKDEVVFTVENRGTSHQLLKNLKLKIKKKILLEADSLKGFAGENVLAKKKRRFRLKKDLFKEVPKVNEVVLVYE